MKTTSFIQHIFDMAAAAKVRLPQRKMLQELPQPRRQAGTIGTLHPARYEGETSEDYKSRRRIEGETVKDYLRGALATHVGRVIPRVGKAAERAAKRLRVAEFKKLGRFQPPHSTQESN